MLRNTQHCQIAYRIRVSVQNMFIVKNADGILDSNSESAVSVVLKPSTKYPVASDMPAVKFAIELIEVDQRYKDLGSREFWSRYSPEGIRKVVPAIFSISSLKSSISKRRSNSPNRVKWADDEVSVQNIPFEPILSDDFKSVHKVTAIQEAEVTDNIVVSPKKSPAPLTKHLKHIAEMEDMLQALKIQLESSDSISPEYNEEMFSAEPTLEKIIGVSSALLNESTKLVESDIVMEQKSKDLDPEQKPQSAFLAHKPQLRPRGRIFELLIKNVSRDASLSPEEIEVKACRISCIYCLI